MSRKNFILPVLLMLVAILACQLTNTAPTAIPSPVGSGNNGGSNLPLKPVRFVNSGTVGATVMAWSYTPLGATAATVPSNASTVALPGGNPSAYLSLPLGTYTWCYHWELGDTNGDGTMDYSHAIDNRAVVLDLNDSDSLEFAERVDISVPPGLGELPGRCDIASNLPGATAQGGGNTTGNNLQLKPVCFLNMGTIGATVMAGSYTPPGGTEIPFPSGPSTVAFPGGNPSACLSLPLGTYTWCYHWELGDVNGDKMMDYSHALDTRPVVLDESDTDDLDLAEKVSIVAPADIGAIPGMCGLEISKYIVARNHVDNAAGAVINMGHDGDSVTLIGPITIIYYYIHADVEIHPGVETTYTVPETVVIPAGETWSYNHVEGHDEHPGDWNVYIWLVSIDE